jgi:hypothetical protein
MGWHTLKSSATVPVVIDVCPPTLQEARCGLVGEKKRELVIEFLNLTTSTLPNSKKSSCFFVPFVVKTFLDALYVTMIFSDPFVYFRCSKRISPLPVIDPLSYKFRKEKNDDVANNLIRYIPFHRLASDGGCHGVFY